MKNSMDESSNIARKMDLLQRPYHASDYPMTVREVVDRMKSFSCNEKTDYNNAQKQIVVANRVSWDDYLILQLGKLITDFCPESTIDEKYRWVGLTPKDPNNPNNAKITEEAEAKISSCVQEASEPSVLLNKACAKKNGMWLQLDRVVGSTVSLPSIHFDVGIHEDLKRWVENQLKSTTPTRFEVCLCDGEKELLCVTPDNLASGSIGNVGVVTQTSSGSQQGSHDDDSNGSNSKELLDIQESESESRESDSQNSENSSFSDTSSDSQNSENSSFSDTSSPPQKMLCIEAEGGSVDKSGRPSRKRKPTDILSPGA